jgi:hypothetical protein
MFTKLAIIEEKASRLQSGAPLSPRHRTALASLRSDEEHNSKSATALPTMRSAKSSSGKHDDGRAADKVAALQRQLRDKAAHVSQLQVCVCCVCAAREQLAAPGAR